MSLDRPAGTEQEGPCVPLVSVVIPTRHRAAMLMQCVGSILAQTVSDIEVIVVVDGPDSATIDFLSNVDDGRLRYVMHPESRGVSNARNTGIGFATGRWLGFCDDDDIWAPTKLAAQLAALREAPDARWAIVGEVRFRDGQVEASLTEPPTPEVVAAELPHSNVVPAGCSGVIADRKLVIELGAFDPRLSVLADRDLWIRLNFRSSVAVANEPLVGYRDHGGAMTRRLRDIERELDVLREKYVDQLAQSGRPFPSDRFYVWAYRRTFSAGDRRGGFDFMVRSPRFRSAIARWLWSRAKRRLGLAQTGPNPPPQFHRSATVTEIPWLGVHVGGFNGPPTQALHGGTGPPEFDTG